MPPQEGHLVCKKLFPLSIKVIFSGSSPTCSGVTAEKRLVTQNLKIALTAAFIRSFVTVGRGPAYSGPQC